MSTRVVAIALAVLAAQAGVAGAETSSGLPPDAIVVAQAPPQTVKPPAKAAPAGKNCRREPVWGFRMSAFCKPTGICPDRVISITRY